MRMSVIARIFRNSRSCFGRQLFIPLFSITRTLFMDSTLRMDIFKASRQRQKALLKNKDEFWNKLQDPQKLIFLEELKLSCVTADKNHIPIVKDALIRFQRQRKQSRSVDVFRIGPVVMRLFHFHNDPDSALEVFHMKEIREIFNFQYAIMVFFDILMLNKRYDEVVTCFEELEELGWTQSLRSRAIPVPYILSLYTKGDSESYRKALKYYGSIINKALVLRRLPLAIAGLALKCDQPAKAVELASRYASHVISFNILIQGFIKMKKWENLLSLLQRPKCYNLSTDTFELLSSNVEYAGEIQDKILQHMENIRLSDQTLDEMLLARIEFQQTDAALLLKIREDAADYHELRNMFSR